MKSFLKLLNVWLLLPLGLYIGLFAIVVIAVYVRVGGPACAPFKEAAAAFRRGDLPAAASALDSARRHGGVLGFEGEAAGVMYLLAGMPAAAEGALDDARAATAVPGENLRWTARSLAARGRIDDAAGVLLRAADAAPLDPTILGEAAEALWASGRRAEARALLERPAGRLTWNPVPWLVRAKFDALDGDLRAAEREIAEAARRAVPQGPAAGETYRLLGALHARSGRPAEARAAFDLARAAGYDGAARLRAAVLPDALLRVWEADAPALRGAYAGAADLAPWTGRPDRSARARAEIAGKGRAS